LIQSETTEVFLLGVDGKGCPAVTCSELVAGYPAVQRILNFDTPEKKTTQSLPDNSPAEILLLLLWRVRCECMFEETFPKAVTTSPHMPLCRQNLQHSNANQTQTTISNIRHQYLGC